MEEQLIGKVSHYFTRLCVAGIQLSDTLRVGDIIRIRGKTTDFVQRATSIEHNRQAVSEAHAGQEIGLLVDYRARPGDRVYRLTGTGAEELLAGRAEDLKERELER